MSLQSVFERHVHYSRGVLRVCEDLYQLDSLTRVFVVAFGLSAHEMAALLTEQIGPLAAGIISAPSVAERTQLPGFRYFHGGHPLPTAESGRAADAILKSLTALPANSFLLFLISPGSSLAETPADKDVSNEDLSVAYAILSDSSATSEESQTVLKHLSGVKGGRMALAAGSKGTQQVSILFSESRSEDPSAIACGPTMPDPTSVEDCYRIATQYKLTEKFPPSIRELFERHALDETPDKDHPAFHNCRWWPIHSYKEHQ